MQSQSSKIMKDKWLYDILRISVMNSFADSSQIYDPPMTGEDLCICGEYEDDDFIVFYINHN